MIASKNFHLSLRKAFANSRREWYQWTIRWYSHNVVTLIILCILISTQFPCGNELWLTLFPLYKQWFVCLYACLTWINVLCQKYSPNQLATPFYTSCKHWQWMHEGYIIISSWITANVIFLLQWEKFVSSNQQTFKQFHCVCHCTERDNQSYIWSLVASHIDAWGLQSTRVGSSSKLKYLCKVQLNAQEKCPLPRA